MPTALQLLLFFLLTVLPHAASAAPAAARVEFMHDGKSTPRAFVLDLESRSGIDVGDYSRKFDVVLSGLDSKAITVELRYEQSLTIMNEGPHLDLNGYVTKSTEWVPLEVVEPGRWRAPAFDSLTFQQDRQPSVDEVLAEVRQRLDSQLMIHAHDTWIELAKTCKPPFDGACIWAESLLSIRITDKSATSDGKTTVAHFILPMGC